MLHKNIKDRGVTGLFSPMKTASVKSADFVPAGQTMDIIAQDEFLAPGQKAFLRDVFSEASLHARLTGTADGKLHGLLSTRDLIAGAVGAGLGLAGGAVVGKLLSDIFALPPTTVRKLSVTGGLAGALYGAGIIQ
jgi:hypothetical protein